MDSLELKKEMPPAEGEPDSADEVDKEDRKGVPRLWIAVCKRASVPGLDVIEKGRIDDLRNALNDPDIIEVQTIYRGFRKDFALETKVIRKLEFV